MSTNRSTPPAAPAPAPPAAIEPRAARAPALPDRPVSAIELIIRYDADLHGAPLDYYSALKAELNRLHTEAGGAGVRLGLARAQDSACAGRISIPVTPLNPADPASIMNEMVRALRASAPLPGVVDVRSRAA